MALTGAAWWRQCPHWRDAGEESSAMGPGTCAALSICSGVWQPAFFNSTRPLGPAPDRQLRSAPCRVPGIQVLYVVEGGPPTSGL